MNAVTLQVFFSAAAKRSVSILVGQEITLIHFGEDSLIFFRKQSPCNHWDKVNQEWKLQRQLYCAFNCPKTTWVLDVSGFWIVETIPKDSYHVWENHVHQAKFWKWPKRLWYVIYLVRDLWFNLSSACISNYPYHALTKNYTKKCPWAGVL